MYMSTCGTTKVSTILYTLYMSPWLMTVSEGQLPHDRVSGYLLGLIMMYAGP